MSISHDQRTKAADDADQALASLQQKFTPNQLTRLKWEFDAIRFALSRFRSPAGELSGADQGEHGKSNLTSKAHK